MLIVLGAGGGIQVNRAVAGSTPRAATPAASPGATPAPAALHRGRHVSVTGSVTIELTDEGFDPSLVQTTNGHDLEVTLINTGARRHAFQIERLHVDVSLDPGQRKTITIKSPPLGDFEYVSDAPGDEQISGILIFYI
ncbi:MAG: cupredoxin domain-containing protein [Thermomicrobiales bacterium]